MIEARQGMRKYPEMRCLETDTIPRVAQRRTISAQVIKRSSAYEVRDVNDIPSPTNYNAID